MITINDAKVTGWEAAIRGMRNPMNSWERSDTAYNAVSDVPMIGPNDKELMMKLVKAGCEHRKFMRYLTVTYDLTAPIVFWQQIDTYKVGTVRNSTSKMHKLLHKPFEMSDFSCEGLPAEANGVLQVFIDKLNNWRDRYRETPIEQTQVRTELWDAILRIMPESYMQKATMLMNYEVLRNIYHQRKSHKLPEWRQFCDWIRTLPYSELITQ